MEGENSNQIPHIGAMLEITSQQGDIFSSDMDEVDRLMELMENEVEEESVSVLKSKVARYKTMAINLREKVKSLTKENERMVRINDLSQKKLHEFKSYSAAEVVEGIKPSLAPIHTIVEKVASLERVVVEMADKLSGTVQDEC